MTSKSRLAATLVLFATSLLPACNSIPWQTPPEDPQYLVTEGSPRPIAPEKTEPELLAACYGALLVDPPAVETMLSAAEIRDLLEGQGFKVWAFSGNLGPSATGLVGNLERGRPLLVLLEPEGGGAFWLLVVGADEERSLILAQRPDETIGALDRELFENWWQRRDRMTILAIPEASLF